MTKMYKQFSIAILLLLVFAINDSSATQYYVVTSGTWKPGTPNSVIFDTTSCGNTPLPNLNPGPGDDIMICRNMTPAEEGGEELLR